ncbi:hypothetical protein J2Z48_001749 [Croceifilum oryzae]|uniref:Uncharacterized protein n=1 Tax=Croceifilum oryzae TaxID=1553429 RepID=A0AAJ1TK44_9BACL|nr:hypothetical protein [Croceifilum oryzae]MDQ0417576.1 hypothetical protein [Croceifilum oryzae]
MDMQKISVDQFNLANKWKNLQLQGFPGRDFYRAKEEGTSDIRLLSREASDAVRLFMEQQNE